MTKLKMIELTMSKQNFAKLGTNKFHMAKLINE